MEVTTVDWTSQFIPLVLWMLLVYAIGLLVIFFIIKLAVRSATSEQRKQAIITNRLLAEQLKAQGIAPEKIEGILAGKSKT